MSPAEDRDLWIRRYHPSPGGDIDLYCFPHAGGAATTYRPLSVTLSPDIEVRAIQYPGRQDRRSEACAPEIGALADALFDVIGAAVKAEPDRRFAFFAHSMGAVVAFEVARRLQDASAPMPVRFFASGRRAPSRRREENVHLRGDREFIAEMRRLGGTDQRLIDDDELLMLMLPTVRSDYRAIETYVYAPGPPLNCPISVLIGDSDPRVTADEARAWADHTTGEIGFHTFSGGHFYLDPQRDQVARVIREVLALGAGRGTTARSGT
jgi:surfactin synthase thioesterase subunit